MAAETAPTAFTVAGVVVALDVPDAVADVTATTVLTVAGVRTDDTVTVGARIEATAMIAEATTVAADVPLALAVGTAATVLTVAGVTVASPVAGGLRTNTTDDVVSPVFTENVAEATDSDAVVSASRVATHDDTAP